MILLLGEPSKIPFPIPCVFDQSSHLADLSRTLGLVETKPKFTAAALEREKWKDPGLLHPVRAAGERDSLKEDDPRQ